jgi:hypothetical protein
MSKLVRVTVSTLFALAAVAGPTVLAAESANAKPATKNVWCC